MTNGVISGTPTVNQTTAVTYTLYANNTGGSDSETFTITINEPVAVLGTIADQTYTRDSAITNLVASNTGGAVATWAINPTLPAGLSMTNGVISGTPTVNQTTAVTYTLYANNSGGSDSETFTITINEPVANLGAISDQTYTRGTAITNLVASNSGGMVATWAISPTLPTGLSMTNGVISGTPNVNQTTAVTYTLYANNSGGSDSVTFTITVNEPVATLSYADAPFTLTRGTAMTDAPPTTGGGAISSWAVHPTLPSGLSLTNGVISGTPSVNLTQTTYTVYANNSGGSVSVDISITINEITPSLTASSLTITGTRGQAITAVTISNSGGNAATWEADPALPAGITLVSGVISGTPTVNLSNGADYIVYANNTGGSDSVKINITISEPAPILSTTPASVTFTNGTAVNWTATNTGGVAAEWSYRSELDAYSARWKMNENSGQSVFDESDSNNTGTISGANWTTGRFGGALEFDGVDDTVVVVNDESLNLTENFSIEGWVWLDSNSNQLRGGTESSGTWEGWTIVDAEGDGWDGYMFGVEAAIHTSASNANWRRLTMLSEQQSEDNNTCTSYQSSAGYGTVVGRGNISVDQWNHVAVVYNSTTTGSEQLEFYINGMLDVAYPCAFTFTPNDEPRYIGSEDGGSLTDNSANMSYWDGRIDELGIWQRVLN